MHISIIECRCILGEGLFVDDRLAAWVDIESNSIYVSTGDTTYSNVLPVQATVILRREQDLISVASASGLGVFDTDARVYREQKTFQAGIVPTGFRTNDGCQLSSGEALIGFMHSESPQKHPGGVFLVDSDGACRLLDDTIRIPNSFIETQDHSIIISDSATGSIYRCELDESKGLVKELWHQVEPGMAPDGGCLLPDGGLAVAMWDGACVRIFEQDGTKRLDVEVSALRPTNAKVDFTSGKLWVTTASSGMTERQLADYPNSGDTLIMDLPLAS